MNIAEEVYESLLGITVEECRLPWVESLFAPGKECYEVYASMLAAYERLLSRLNREKEDPDLEILVNSLLDYSHAAALKMFEYGMLYQKTQNIL